MARNIWSDQRVIQLLERIERLLDKFDDREEKEHEREIEHKRWQEQGARVWRFQEKIQTIVKAFLLEIASDDESKAIDTIARAVSNHLIPERSGWRQEYTDEDYKEAKKAADEFDPAKFDWRSLRLGPASSRRMERMAARLKKDHKGTR